MLEVAIGTIVLVSPTTESFCQEMIESTSIEFISNGQKLANPLAGGLANPIFSAAHLNNDGMEDLFIFDFNGKSLSCLLTVSENNQFKTMYVPLFPTYTAFVLIARTLFKDAFQIITNIKKLNHINLLPELYFLTIKKPII